MACYTRLGVNCLILEHFTFQTLILKVFNLYAGMKYTDDCSMVVAHAFNPSTQEAEAGGSLWVQGQPDLWSEFQESQDYKEKPWLKQ